MDVLAVRQDGLTAFTSMVECKAWMQMVDKGVIAKGVPATLASCSLGVLKAFYVGVLRQKNTYEVAVLSALDGKQWNLMEDLLTHEFGRFRAELAELAIMQITER